MPLQKLSKRDSKFEAKPWITKGIKVSIAKKNKLYRDYLRFKNDYFLSKFRYHRNKLKYLLLITKKQYYTNFFINHNNDIKNTWRGIKQIINIKRTSYNTPHKMK